MKIKSISATNLKGRTFSHELGDNTAIVGRNFSGKTSIIEAIRLALLGYLPELGKTNKSTFDLSDGRDMEVGIVMDDGLRLNRRFYLEGGTVKMSALAINSPECFKIDLPLLNSEEYFGLTDTQRIQYVFERSKPNPDYTIDGMMARLERIAFGESHSETVQTVKGNVMASVRKETVNRNTLEAITVLTADKGTLKTEFAYWNKRAKETIGATKIFTELKVREGECSASTIHEIDEQLKLEREAHDEANCNAGEIVARLNEAHRVESRREEIQKILDRGAVDHRKEISDLKKEIKSLSKAVPMEKIDAAELRARLTKHDKEIGRIEGELSRLNKAIVEALENIDDLEHKKECPYCKSKGKDWKKNIEDDYRAQVESGKKEQTRLQKEQDSHSKEAEALREQIKKIEQHQESLLRDERSRREKEARLMDLEGKQENDKRRIEQLTSELASLKSVEAPSREERDELSKHLKELGDSISRLEERKCAAITLQHDLKRAAEAELYHQEAAAYVLVIKAIGAELKALQSEMVEKTFAGLLSVANGICGDILKSPLAFHEGEIGRWEGHRFISHRVFSGTEKTLCYISIAAALSAQAPFRLLILDELGRLDGENRADVMESLDRAQKAGVIDQVIVAHTAMLATGDNWKLISL